ncbi:hypothetical protein C8J57DRAFT_1277544 [Mycena rebaudengoi]|nr:hypothetical protein C8J57DRAFT_1277544 [Mycena rebaudengoi]
MAYSLFPSVGHQLLSALVHFFGITVLTFFFSRRLAGEDISKRRLTWPRICILLILLDSYLFIFSSGLLIFGVGLQYNSQACSAGIFLCIVFYGSSKIMIYAFLIEKVYIVWDNGTRRLRSPVYLVCMGTLCMYSAVVVVMLLGRIVQFRSGDGACVIGLKSSASIALLSYDLYINILLTGLFLWPLFRSRHSSLRLRRVATRTLVASGAALTTSTVNIAVLTLMKGRQLGWVCLASCEADVILNAIALFWVTAGISQPLTLSGSARAEVAGGTSAGATLSMPGTPTRLKHDEVSKTSFRMGELSPTTKEFQIRVTTESHVSTDPAAEEDGKPCT